MDFIKDIDNSCGFHIEKHGEFCAPVKVVNKLKDFVLKLDFKKNKLNHGSPGSDEKELMGILKKELDCKSEACILQHDEVRKIIPSGLIDQALNTNFKPSGPRDTTAWLSNFDIDDVLKQVQAKYTDKKFLHIPFQMTDFEKQNTELARLDWKKEYDAGFRTFGTVMNTDISSGNGIHWFAIFADFLDDSETFTIEYFNSSGELPSNEVLLWMKRIKHELSPHFKKPIKDIVVTRLVNQYDEHSCGPYSLYYILSRLYGVPYNYFANNKIGDKNMLQFRKYLFRAEN